MSRPDPIATSGLPAEIQELLQQVIRRARLWRRERHALTLELLAHFHDGLDAGRTADDLIKAFGDPTLAAKLMRRAKKRNRPLWWQIGRRSLQTLGVFILFYLGAMAFLMTGRPQLKVDYVAQLCEKAEAVPQADRAWPIYRDAWLKDPPGRIGFSPKPPGDPRIPEQRKPAYYSLADNGPNDPHWDQAVALVQQHEGLLDAAHAAAVKPGLGITLRERRDASSDYRKLFPFVPATGLVSPMDGVLDAHENGAIYTTINLLSIDIRWAASQNDPERVLRDCRTIAGLYRHASETRTLIADLLRLIAVRRIDATIAEVIVSRPDVLSARQYDELLQMTSSTRNALEMGVGSQRLYFLNLVQRLYTDSGNGDGRLTQEGAEYVMWGTDEGPRITSALALPLLSACVASRREITDVANELYDLLERELQLPLAEMLDRGHQQSDLDKSILGMSETLMDVLHYWPLSVVIPQFVGVGKDVHMARAVHDALTVALALELCRREEGAYPPTLDQLVPRYLPAIPADPLHNQPLRYTLSEGKPVIYAPGRDGKDRGGKPTATRRDTVPEAADWILFPPQP